MTSTPVRPRSRDSVPGHPPATSPAAPAAPRRRGVGPRLRRGLPALLLSLPVLVVFAYFAWGPIVRGLVMSFQRTNLVDDAEWVGLDNFAYVLGDPLLGTAVVNTLWFTVLALVLGFPLPIALAILLTELRRTRGLAAVLVYLPVVTPPVVAVLLWRTFYDPSATGLFNTVLGWLSLPPQPWLNSTASAMPAIVLEVTWASAGSAVIIYLASIASVRAELYEAAELDGAGIRSRIRHVTLPHLRGVILVMLLLQVIGTTQVFTEPFLFTGGGPQNSTLTVLMLVYDYAFVRGDYGAATALSLLLALVLALLSVLYQVATRRWSADA